MMPKSSKTTPIKPVAPSSNWKALKQALHPSASNDLSLKRKRSRIESSATPQTKGKEKEVETRQRPVNGLKAKEAAIIDVLEGPQFAWQNEVGQYLAIDCEMVGVGPEGIESTLARVSIVNWHGAVMLDRFVRPREKVTDYRTWVSGIREEDLTHAPTFADVQKEVAKLIEGRILIGHAISNDTQVLLLSHPRSLTRDTAKYAPLQGLARTKRPGLKNLAKLVLGVDIQAGEHSSVDDARATMAIYRSQKSAWEDSLRTHKKPSLVTNSTPALSQLDLSKISLTGLGKDNPNHHLKEKKSFGLAATLRQARHEQAEEEKTLRELDSEQTEQRQVKKARREENDDLVLGFDYEKPVVHTVKTTDSIRPNKKTNEAGKLVKKVKKAVGAAFKGDREKRPKSKEGWWDD